MQILSKTNINFLKWRWPALALSIVVIVAGLATIIGRGGMRLGVDFQGGTLVVLEFAQPVGEDAVRNALRTMGDVVVQQYGDDPRWMMVRVPTPLAEQGTSLEAQATQIKTTLEQANIGTFTVENQELVGPTIGADLRRKGILATVTALGGILAYIWFRFRFSFAVGAIAATAHDVLVTLVMLDWFNYELSLNIVAAILTITGYSVNDTIVIFDRVRENLRLSRRDPLDQVVNTAVNQTLSRTIITAGTTFLAVLGLFLYGGEVLEGMAFTLLVGIVSGTYSTIFIASAIAILLSKSQGPAAVPATQAQARTRARARKA
jgi:preprotein translocase subunit SecF